MSVSNNNNNKKVGVRFSGVDWDKESLKLERRTEKVRDQERKKRKAEHNMERLKYNERARELAFLCGFFCFMDRQSLSDIVKSSCGSIFLSGFMPIPSSSTFDQCFAIFEMFLKEYRQGLLDMIEPPPSSASNAGTAVHRRRGRGSLLKKVLRQFYDARDFALSDIDLQQKLNVWFYWKLQLETLQLYTPLDRFLQSLFSVPVDILKENCVPHEFLRQFYNHDEKYLEERFLERKLRAADLDDSGRRGFQEWEDVLVKSGSYARYDAPTRSDGKSKCTTPLCLHESSKESSVEAERHAVCKGSCDGRQRQDENRTETTNNEATESSRSFFDDDGERDEAIFWLSTKNDWNEIEACVWACENETNAALQVPESSMPRNDGSGTRAHGFVEENKPLVDIRAKPDVGRQDSFITFASFDDTEWIGAVIV
ncbi:hypothetical protein ACA910_012312 [Epithemia clementina (nom. ined.)]